MTFPSVSLPKLDFGPLGAPVNHQGGSSFYVRGDPNNPQAGFSLSFLSPSGVYSDEIIGPNITAMAAAVNQALSDLVDKVIFQNNAGYTSLEGMFNCIASGNFVVRGYADLTEWNNFRTSGFRAWDVPEISVVLDASPIQGLTLANKLFYPNYNRYAYHVEPLPGLPLITSGPVIILTDIDKNNQNYTSPTCTTGENGPYFAYTVLNGLGVGLFSDAFAAGDVPMSKDIVPINKSGLGQRTQSYFPLIKTTEAPTQASYGTCLGLSLKPHTFIFHHNLSDSYSWTADSTKDVYYTPNPDGSPNYDFPSKQKIANLYFTDEHAKAIRLGVTLVEDYSGTVPKSDVTLRDFYVANGNVHFDPTQYSRWDPEQQMNVSVSLYQWLSTDGSAVAATLPNPLYGKYEPIILKTLRHAYNSLVLTDKIKVLQSINDIHALAGEAFLGILKVTEPVRIGEHQIGYGEIDPDTPSTFFADNANYDLAELGSYVLIACDGGMSGVLSPLGRPVSVIYVNGTETSTWEYLVNKFTPNGLYSELTDILFADAATYQYPAVGYKAISLSSSNQLSLQGREDGEAGSEIVISYEPELASKSSVTAWVSHGGRQVMWPDLQATTNTSNNNGYVDGVPNTVKFYLTPVSVDTDASIVISGVKYDFVIPGRKQQPDELPQGNPPFYEPVMNWASSYPSDFATTTTPITNYEAGADYPVSVNYGTVSIDLATGIVTYSAAAPVVDTAVSLVVSNTTFNFVVNAAANSQAQGLMNIVFAKVLELPTPAAQTAYDWVTITDQNWNIVVNAGDVIRWGDPATNRFVETTVTVSGQYSYPVYDPIFSGVQDPAYDTLKVVQLRTAISVPVSGPGAYRENCMFLVGDPVNHNVISIAVSTNTGDKLLFAPNSVDITNTIKDTFSLFNVTANSYTDSVWNTASQPLVQLVQSANSGKFRVFSDRNAVSAAFRSETPLTESFVFAVADATWMFSEYNYVHDSEANVYELVEVGQYTVESGFALYVFDSATGKVTKISEQESLDYVLTWSGIQGKPSSSAEEIDSAVSASHVHANQAVLEMITDNLGALQYKAADVVKGLTFSW